MRKNQGKAQNSEDWDSLTNSADVNCEDPKDA